MECSGNRLCSCSSEPPLTRCRMGYATNASNLTHVLGEIDPWHGLWRGVFRRCADHGYSVAVAHGEREFYCLLGGACSGHGQRLLGKKCCYGTAADNVGVGYASVVAIRTLGGVGTGDFPAAPLCHGETINKRQVFLPPLRGAM